MPARPARPCCHPGCGRLVRDGTGRCESHKVREGSFADRKRGSRHERGYDSKWDKTRERIMVRDNGLCQPCLKNGRIATAKQVDHILCKADWKRKHGTLQGVDAEHNLQAICTHCHQTKTAEEAKRGRGV